MDGLDSELEQALRVLQGGESERPTALPNASPALREALERWSEEHRDVLVKGPVLGATSGDLFRHFNAWTQERGYPAFPRVVRSWGAQVHRLGFVKGRRWKGYREERPMLMNSTSARYWADWLLENPRPQVDPLTLAYQEARIR